MYPRNLQLENWPWRAISQRQTAVNGAMRDLLPGLLRVEAFVRRSRFVTANRIGVQYPSGKAQPGPPRLEHRLYALFAE
jgi:hypothetical protein